MADGITYDLSCDDRQFHPPSMGLPAVVGLNLRTIRQWRIHADGDAARLIRPPAHQMLLSPFEADGNTSSRSPCGRGITRTETAPPRWRRSGTSIGCGFARRHVATHHGRTQCHRHPLHADQLHACGFLPRILRPSISATVPRVSIIPNASIVFPPH